MGMIAHNYPYGTGIEGECFLLCGKKRSLSRQFGFPFGEFVGEEDFKLFQI